ncbi:MAG: type II toxin-antitoxin system VapC family toxin [Candidatus Sumerlaeota bacterium]|nr:type II toxin-antitoxin system VapC family toxin [Candidatus Sumerlaeota bacterium]
MVKRYLLDTNQLSKLLENEWMMVDKVEQLGWVNICTSAAVYGELIFMAFHSMLKEENLRKVFALMDDLRVLPIDSRTAQLYGEIKERFIKRFAPKVSKERVHIDPSALGLHENDLWIASAAIQHECTLVTADSHFARIQEIHPFALTTWWRP